MGSVQTWEQTVAQKRALRDRALEPYMTSDIGQRPPRIQNVHHRTCIHYDPTIQEITDIDSVPILLECLKRGQYTAEQVILAYIKR
jgi:amidase